LAISIALGNLLLAGTPENDYLTPELRARTSPVCFGQPGSEER
jgi:hypothetical protein